MKASNDVRMPVKTIACRCVMVVCILAGCSGGLKNSPDKPEPPPPPSEPSTPNKFSEPSTPNAKGSRHTKTQGALDDGGCVHGGCSGQLCTEAGPQNGGISTCEWRDEYACYQRARCARNAHGVCAFVMDEQLAACLRQGVTESDR